MSSSQKTSRRFAREDSQLSLVDSETLGTEQQSFLSRQEMSALLTDAIESSSAPSEWITPTRRDWQDAGDLMMSMVSRKGRIRINDSLPRQIWMVERPTDPAMRSNAAWTESLMGFPAGWTELDALPPKSPRVRSGPRVRVNLSTTGKRRASRKASVTAVTD